jgi:hypothetical protein
MSAVNKKWISDRSEIKSHPMGLVNAVYPNQEAVISSGQENCYKNFLPFTINVENLTKTVYRK